MEHRIATVWVILETSQKRIHLAVTIIRPSLGAEEKLMPVFRTRKDARAFVSRASLEGGVKLEIAKAEMRISP